jgi:hypothetical protein
MNDEPALISAGDAPRKSFWGRHPKLAILLIAGVFYAILIGMCLFVLVLLLVS